MAEAPQSAPPTTAQGEMDRARDLASELANRYRPRDPALTRPGFSRGIDYYKFDALVQVLAVVLAVYRNTAGRYPDLLNPKLYSEKVSALKFLAPLKVPESGNKLLTASFLTPEARSTIRIPEVVWHSAEPILPMNGAMEDGDYYLKTTHGSGRCRRICFPLSAGERAKLEAMATHWLSRGYGLLAGEWWYNVFPRRLLLERAVTRRNPSAAVLYYVFRGRVAVIACEEKYLDGTDRNRVNLYDPSFQPLRDQKPGTEPVRDLTLSGATRDRAVAAAESIGRQFDAVRVDFIPGDDEQLFLNEITFASKSGLPPSTPGLDEELGRLWGACSFIR